MKRISDVRSIQRLSNTSKLNQEEISNEYISWLPRYLKSFVRAERVGDNLKFFSIGISSPLLMLKKIDEAGSLDRVKFHIVGGLLTKEKQKGWLEFRIIDRGRYTLASINDFIPALPWFIYKYTQAPIHKIVMMAFGRHLGEIKKDN